jgi:hypothetical protein
MPATGVQIRATPPGEKLLPSTYLNLSSEPRRSLTERTVFIENNGKRSTCIQLVVGLKSAVVVLGEPALQLDDHLKNLLRELGHAINDTVSESERITGAIAGVRAHGYDIVLKLDATIGLARRDGSEMPKMTTQDRRFLESLRIQVDQESLDQDPDKRQPSRLAMTPQDVRFLKSLRIATDEAE